MVLFTAGNVGLLPAASLWDRQGITAGPVLFGVPQLRLQGLHTYPYLHSCASGGC
jgi:hypothetical protein